MKSFWLLGIYISLILACNTAPVQTPETVSETAVSPQTVLRPRTEADSLETAIREVSNYLNNRFPQGPQGRRSIAILNIQSDFPALSNRIIDMLTDNAVNDDVFRTLNRQQLDIIRGEINFNQTSGEVSSQTLQRAGQFAGAGIVVIGDVVRIGNIFQLRIQALEVERALIEGHIIINITNNSEMASYTGLPVRTSSAATTVDPLDTAIREIANYMNDRITPRSKLAILDIQSDFPALSDEIIKRLTDHAVNDRNFQVVNRHDIDIIRNEIGEQNTSGEVSEATLVRAGRMTGAETIIIGRVSQVGDIYELRIQALDVQTIMIKGHIIREISNSSTIASLTGITRSARATRAEPLNDIIREAVNYLNDRRSIRGNRVAILDIQSDIRGLNDVPELERYILYRLIDHAVNDQNFQVVNRHDIDAARGELGLHHGTGEIDENTRLRVGDMTGADTIIVGNISQHGNTYRLRIQALGVEEGIIEGSQEWTIPSSPTISLLTQRAVTTENVTTRRIDSIWNSAVSAAQSARRQEVSRAWWRENGIYIVGGIVAAGALTYLIITAPDRAEENQ